MSRNEFSIGFW